MKKAILSTIGILLAVAAVAQSSYDQDKPFGFCTVSSRTDASSTYNCTGGGCWTYPIPEELADKMIVLKSNGQDMQATIRNAIKQKDIIILDGSDGDFIVSSSIGFERGNKTLLGINNARICTQWYLTDEDKTLLDNATAKDKNGNDVVGVKNMSTNSSDGLGGTVNGNTIKEQAEYMTRKTLFEKYGNENYRNAGILSLNKENVIIRNITFVGPGAVDVGGADLLSASGAKHCWIDHCTFLDGEDGNFDITNVADFNTVSWCIFRYTDRSYMHQNTNLVGSGDSNTADQEHLNTTFAFNWWATGCKQRMPMARYGKIHMLNNYYSCAGASNCINPRKNSEFLIEGNYFTSGVTSFYSQTDAIAVTWGQQNYHASKPLPSSMGSTVTVPYDYTVAPYADVPDAVTTHAGATLKYGTGGDEPVGTKGSVYWPMSSNTNAEVATAIANNIISTSVQNGSNLTLRTNGTYGNIRFSLYQAQTIQKTPADDNAVTFSFQTKEGYKFKATDIELYACKVATNNGTIDISWTDAGGTKTLLEGASPNRNNAENNYYSLYSLDASDKSTATEGTCALTINLYNVGATSQTGELQKKDIGLAQVTIKGVITDKATGISTSVSFSPALSTEYYNVAGQKVDSNAKGVVILRQRMADGSIQTKKIFR